MKRILGLGILALGLAACGGSGVQQHPSTGSTGSTGTTGNSGTTGGGFSPCSSANACPSGEFCFNGICAIGCNADTDCASNQYCDTTGTRLCQDKTVATCTGNGDCASTQVCTNGFCSLPPPNTQCQATYDQNDGCDANSICENGYDSSGNPITQCESYPACAQDGSCPVGTEGSVCNDGYISGKNRICLATVCKDVNNCPAQWKCIKDNSSNVLGQCSNGSFGQACNGNADCQNGHCQTFPSGGGVCF